MKTNLFCRLIPTLILGACGQAEPVPYESLSWVNNYYIEHPVASLSSTAGGWLFRGAKDQGGQLTIGFLAPKPMSDDRAKRQAILERICPPKSEKIWEMLPSRNSLVINVWTKNNKFKDSIKC